MNYDDILELQPSARDARLQDEWNGRRAGNVGVFHSSELNNDACDAGDAESFAPGWYVCPCIPEGAIVDRRLRGPFETTVEAFRMQAIIESGRDA